MARKLIEGTIKVVAEAHIHGFGILAGRMVAHPVFEVLPTDALADGDCQHTAETFPQNRLPRHREQADQKPGIVRCEAIQAA